MTSFESAFQHSRVTIHMKSCADQIFFVLRGCVILRNNLCVLPSHSPLRHLCVCVCVCVCVRVRSRVVAKFTKGVFLQQCLGGGGVGCLSLVMAVCVCVCVCVCVRS